MTVTPATLAPVSITARPLRCRNCGAERAPAPVAICDQCLGPLDPVYDPTRRLPDRATIAGRAPSLWRYQEWLPFDGDPVLSLDTGFTPLVEAPALARRLGVARAWVKNDTVSHPSLSFKDRVVAVAVNAAAAFGLDTIGCASTGNLANAVVAYEIMEQLGWRLPTAVVAPMAGGSLVTKLRKGFGEFQDAGLVHGVLPRLYGAQPSGCAPIVRLVERGGTRIEPEVPDTIYRS